MDKILIIGVSSISVISVTIIIIIIYMSFYDNTGFDSILTIFDTSKSDTSKSGTSKSDTSKSDASKSDASKSDTSKSDASKSDTGNTNGSSCIRGTNVKTWNETYDACDLENKAKEKCDANDGRWAYDAYWDSRMARGASCGKDQSKYGDGSVKWENVCDKLRSGNFKYKSLGCN